MERWNKIIDKKIAKIKDDKSFQLAQVDEKDNSKYLAMFKLEGGHYKDQVHVISIDLKCENPKAGPDDWFPSRPPKTKFITKMFHTNVSPASGWICLDILQDKWSPMYNIDKLIENIILLLDDPAPTGNHLNGEAAQLQQACQKKFDKLSKGLKKLHGEEYDNLYSECFAEFDAKCSEKYDVNKGVIAKYLPKFSRFADSV